MASPEPGYTVCVDEVGRGCLFGPVVAAAVILPGSFPDNTYLRIRDSKKVSPKERERLAAYIREHAIAYGIGEASVDEIDRVNILQATYWAMHRALDQVWRTTPFAHMRIDGPGFSPYMPPGRYDEGPEITVECVVDGDATDRGIAAASIIAKDYRDSLICRMVEANPDTYTRYGLLTNMGYGTAAHLKALREHGPTAQHRRSFRPVADAARPETDAAATLPGSAPIRLPLPAPQQ